MKTIVVEDDPFWAREIEVALSADGHDVFLASTGKEALTLAGKYPDAGMVLDIVLPDFDGIEVLRALSASAPSMRVLAISGGGRLGADFCLRLASKMGAGGRLAKPFSHHDLTQTWDQLLAA
jgi:DNA-binding response OmpR family regulator